MMRIGDQRSKYPSRIRPLVSRTEVKILAIVLSVLAFATSCSSGGGDADSDATADPIDWFDVACPALGQYNQSVLRMVQKSQELAVDPEVFAEADTAQLMREVADDGEELTAVVVSLEPGVLSEDLPIYGWFRDLVFDAVAGTHQFVNGLDTSVSLIELRSLTTAEMVSTLSGPYALTLSGIPKEADPELLAAMADTRPETLESMGGCAALTQRYEFADPMDLFPFPSALMPDGPAAEPWAAILVGEAELAAGQSDFPGIAEADLIGNDWTLIVETEPAAVEGELDAGVELLSSLCSLLVQSDDPPILGNPEPVSWQMTQIERSHGPGSIVVSVEEYADSAAASEAIEIVRRSMGCLTQMGVEPLSWALPAELEADVFGLTVDNSGVTSLPVLPGLAPYDEAPAGVSEMIWIQRSRWVLSIVTDPYGVGAGASSEVAELVVQRMADR